ncbi:Hypothetical_protein [Hexamita inflata]|uniref:Hypothetical_protein n=1 Tax=Hexamita inflata TaxID=28002 RepID=A0AA86PXD7_9EUKA|nr:Hypothetical protein HINF_LOCUS16030 [Hexamita inflata]CAI9942797.1 Hypothetical protein HINF_LOCUS30442 [Hexamita inflata]
MNYPYLEMQIKFLLRKQKQHDIIKNSSYTCINNFYQKYMADNDSQSLIATMSKNYQKFMAQSNSTFHSQLTNDFSCQNIDSAIIQFMISVSEDVSVDYEVNLLESELTDFQYIEDLD